MFEYNNYRRNLSVSLEKNFFVLPWASVVVKNCNEDGELLQFKTMKSYRDQGQSFWVLLKLSIFHDNLGLFPVLACFNCESMKGVGDFCLDQDRDVVEQLKCFHSKAAKGILGDYNDHWIVEDPDDDDQSHQIKVNEDIFVQSLIDKPSESFLGAVQNNNKVSILYTVSQRQKIPFCTGCSSQKCKCFYEYKKKIRENVAEDDNENANEEEFHWDRRKKDKVTPRDDFNEALELNEQYRCFGCNLTPFDIPLREIPFFKKNSLIA